MKIALPSVLTACVLSGCVAKLDGPPRFISGGSLVGDYSLGMTTLEDSRFLGVIRQKYDFSCGSAALATLLSYHYNFDVREETAFRGMWAAGDQDQIRKVGFSLLDMKQWLASRGLSADGYEVSLELIAETGIPGIALITVDNYRHFVVVKGVRAGEVLVGDPSVGLTTMPVGEFKDVWNGVYFVISEHRDRGRLNFDRDRQWAAYNRAPTRNGFSDPLSQQALMLTAPFYGDIS